MLSSRQRPELDADSLEAIRVALAEKLRRRYRQSESFVAEVTDELVDQAYIEYAEKPESERGQVRSLVGYLVAIGERRALDRVRREGLEVYGEGAEDAIERAAADEPSVEVLAARGIEAAKIHEAVAELGDEQRRALVHAFWEELPVREAAKAMGLSTMTFCRRRDAAIGFLRERFGVAEGDPLERHLVFEAGFAAWVGMVAGHGVGLLASIPDPGMAAETAHRIAGAVVTRARALVSALSNSTHAGTDAIGGVSAQAAAKGAGLGVAAAVAAICGAGVVGVGPGAGLLDPGNQRVHHPDQADVRPSRVPPQTSQAQVARSRPAPGRTTRQRGQHAQKRHQAERRIRHDSRGRKYTLAAERAVRSQELSGATETTAPESGEGYVGEPAPAEPYVGEPEGGGSSAATQAAESQFAP